MLKRILALKLIAVVVFALGVAPGAAFAKGVSLIRDAEIENTIRTYAAPVFRAAGLEPDGIDIYLVKDNSLNAFVAGGQKVFLNTGLLLRTNSANEIIGVIAHETGHIAGGHLSRVQDALSKSTVPVILSFILGSAATVATGRGDVGAAIIAGGQTVAAKNFLKYSRTQEAAADHAALRFLDRTKQSARGLLNFMDVLSDQELLSTARQDPYVRSHPLTRDRIATLANHVATSPYSETRDTAEFIAMHERLVAKLFAFINPFSTTLRRYKKGDDSLPARYARAIAHYRKPDLPRAVGLVDELIAERPRDPYFHELKGQMLFENGRTTEALASYETAVSLLPDAHLIRRELARVQLEVNDPAFLDPAIDNLKAVLARDRQSSFTWRQLAIAYGRKGEKGHSSLALAEEALLTRKPAVAVYHAGLAERLFPSGSREWIQARDIHLAAKQLEKNIAAQENR